MHRAYELQNGVQWDDHWKEVYAKKVTLMHPAYNKINKLFNELLLILLIRPIGVPANWRICSWIRAEYHWLRSTYSTRLGTYFWTDWRGIY